MEPDTRSANIVESIAIIIFNPSNSMGRVRIITLVEIASKRFLNFNSLLLVIPNILVKEREIVVTDQIPSTHEIVIPIENIDEASYLTSTPSGLPEVSDRKKRNCSP